MSGGTISGMIRRVEGLIENHICGDDSASSLSQAFSDIRSRIFSGVTPEEMRGLKELKGRIEILNEIELNKEELDMNLVEQGSNLNDEIDKISPLSSSLPSSSAIAPQSGSAIESKIQRVETLLTAYTGEKDNALVLSNSFKDLLDVLKGNPILNFQERGSLMQLQDLVLNFHPKSNVSELRTSRFQLFSRLGDLEEKVGEELEKLASELSDKSQNGTLKTEDIKGAAKKVKEAYVSCIVDVFDKRNLGRDVASQSKLSKDIQGVAEKIKMLSDYVGMSSSQSEKEQYELASVKGLLSEADQNKLWKKNRLDGVLEQVFHQEDPELCDKLTGQFSLAIDLLKEKIRNGRAGIDDVKDVRTALEKAYCNYVADVSSSKEEASKKPVRQVLLDVSSQITPLLASCGDVDGELLSSAREDALWAGKLGRIAFKEPYGFVLSLEADVRAGTALAQGIPDAEADQLRAQYGPAVAIPKGLDQAADQLRQRYREDVVDRYESRASADGSYESDRVLYCLEKMKSFKDLYVNNPRILENMKKDVIDPLKYDYVFPQEETESDAEYNQRKGDFLTSPILLGSESSRWPDNELSKEFDEYVLPTVPLNTVEETYESDKKTREENFDETIGKALSPKFLDSIWARKPPKVVVAEPSAASSSSSLGRRLNESPPSTQPSVEVAHHPDKIRRLEGESLISLVHPGSKEEAVLARFEKTTMYKAHTKEQAVALVVFNANAEEKKRLIQGLKAEQRVKGGSEEYKSALDFVIKGLSEGFIPEEGFFSEFSKSVDLLSKELKDNKRISKEGTVLGVLIAAEDSPTGPDYRGVVFKFQDGYAAAL